MTNHMEAAVKTVAKHMAETALDWTDAEADGHEHDLECTNWEAYTGDAQAALEAALPHLRAMIAEETANSWIPHRDELAQAIASGYEPDHPVPNRHDYKATDSVLRLLTAARNAEGIQA